MAEFRSVPEDTIPVSVTNAQGNQYTIYANNKEEEEANRNTDFSTLDLKTSRPCVVSWAPENKWIQTGDAITAAIHIRSYMLKDDGIPPKNVYELSFEANTAGFYIFTDETGQENTKLVTTTNMTQTLSYNSGKPKIVHVHYLSKIPR